MKSSTKLPRSATATGAVLALALVAAFAMSAQAAYMTARSTSTARSVVMHLCRRSAVPIITITDINGALAVRNSDALGTELQLNACLHFSPPLS